MFPKFTFDRQLQLSGAVDCGSIGGRLDIEGLGKGTSLIEAIEPILRHSPTISRGESA